MLGQSNDICKTHTFLWITNTQYRLAKEIEILAVNTKGFLLETAMPLFEPRTLMKETAASIQMKTFGSHAIII